MPRSPFTQRDTNEFGMKLLGNGGEDKLTMRRKRSKEKNVTDCWNAFGDVTDFDLPFHFNDEFLFGGDEKSAAEIGLRVPPIRFGCAGWNTKDKNCKWVR